MVDTKKLNEVIEDRGLKKKWLAEKMAMSECTFFSRLRGQTEFSVSEMVTMSSLLHMTDEEQKTVFRLTA